MPLNLMCFIFWPGIGSGVESGMVVAVLVTVTGKVLLCIAMTIICVVIWRKRSRLQSKSVETNADIQLNSNEEYGEVMRKRIPTRPNLAYEHVNL